MPPEFHVALRNKDVDAAASIWSRVAEQALLHLHAQQVGSSLRLGQPRGKIQFDSTRELPRSQREHADCLQLRRLGRAFRQASEVCKCGPGTRADRTWRNLQSILPVCPSQWQSELMTLLQDRPCHDVARKVMHLLQAAMQFLQAERQSFRLKLWKQTMRSCQSKASSWRKTHELQVNNPHLSEHRHYSAVVMKVGGSYTIDPTRQLQALTAAWDKIFGKHRHSCPSTWQFLQHYGPYIRKESFDLQPLTKDTLLTTLRNTKNSSAGLDGWQPQDLRLLGQACPDLFSFLAQLMQVCEQQATWPSTWTTGYVSMLAKEVNSQGQIEDVYNFRPITVLSALYRLWSRARCLQIKDWITKVLPDEIYALRAGQGADDMAVNVSALLEEADLMGEWSGGLSYDFAKCYDHIIPSMAIDVFLYRGAPLSVIQGLRGFYKAHCKHFKLGTAFGTAYQPANGIVQGDPLSNFLLASLVACWLERLTQGRFTQVRRPARVAPRVYVDDISATAIASDLQALRAVLRDTHSTVQQFAHFSGSKLNPGKCFTYGLGAGNVQLAVDQLVKWHKARAPIVDILKEVTDSEEACVRIFGTRRSKTLRNRFHSWGKFARWLETSKGRVWPAGLQDLLDYATEAVKEGAGKTTIDSFSAALSVLEQVGRFGEGDMLSRDPTWISYSKNVTAELVEKGPMLHQAAQPTVAMALSLELYVFDEDRARYARALAFVALLMLWGSMRSDDVQCMRPESMRLTIEGLSCKLWKTKTTGPDRRINMVQVFISRKASLSGLDWLAKGHEIWSEIKDTRDFLVLQASEDWETCGNKGVDAPAVSLYVRKIYKELCVPRWVEGRWMQNKERLLLPGDCALHFSGHSARNFLTSIAAAIRVPKDDRDFLGRWKVGGGGSADYTRTARQIVHRIQEQVAETVLLGRERGYVEADALDALQSFAEERGEIGAVVRARHELVRANKVGGNPRLGGRYPPLYMQSIPGPHVITEEAAEDQPETAAAPKGEAKYFISVSKKTGFRRLHVNHACYVKPFKCQDVVYLDQVAATDFDAICKDCKLRIRSMADDNKAEDSSSGEATTSSSDEGMAVTEAEMRERVNSVDADLQYVLQEAGASLATQYAVCNVHSTLRRFQAIADDRAGSRTAANTDFGVPRDTPAGRQQTAAIVAAWELAKEISSKEIELRAEARALNQPRILQTQERQAMLRAVSAAYGKLNEAETPSAEYLALKAEETEQNEPTAAQLDTITSKRDSQTATIQSSVDPAGHLRITKTKQKVEMPQNSEAYRRVLKIEGYSWLAMQSRYKSKTWLQGLTMADFTKFVDYILGERVAGLRLEQATGYDSSHNALFRPPWGIVLRYEYKLRKEAFRLVNDEGQTLQDALAAVTKDTELKEVHFVTPLTLTAFPMPSKWTPDGKDICFAYNNQGCQGNCGSFRKATTKPSDGGCFVLESPEDLGATKAPRAEDIIRLYEALPKEVSARDPEGRIPSSFSTGAYNKGGLTGLRKACHDFPLATKCLVRFVRSMRPFHPFSTISIYDNVCTALHKDGRNACCENLIIPLTQFSGGELWMQQDQGATPQNFGGSEVFGTAVPIPPEGLCFDARGILHCTMPWKGRRLIAVAFTVSKTEELKKSDAQLLEDLGINCPSASQLTGRTLDAGELSSTGSSESEPPSGGEDQQADDVFRPELCGNFGNPLMLEWDGRESPITDGYGLCSPTRWHPASRGASLPEGPAGGNRESNEK
ncbi:unnamed protein product [Symbiodinium sp. CCMP2592]|nr:unnamed protein product [Symbiodinium sp. CCMP2592]